MVNTTPTEYANQLRTSYENLMRTFGLLDPTEGEEGRLASGWSPKALIAHVAYWDQVQMERMHDALTGASAVRGYQGPAADNDARAQADAGRDLDAVLADADAARSSLIDFAASLTPEDLERTLPEGAQTVILVERLHHAIDHTRTHARELWSYCGSMERWTRPSLRAFLVHQNDNLMDSISCLSEAAMVGHRVEGDWTIRDLLVHILAWREYGYLVVQKWPDLDRNALAAWIANDNYDVVNAELMDARAHLDMIDIADGLVTYYRRLLKRFDEASDAALASIGDYGWGEQGELSGFFYSLVLHEMEHAGEIWSFRTAT